MRLGTYNSGTVTLLTVDLLETAKKSFLDTIETLWRQRILWKRAETVDHNLLWNIARIRSDQNAQKYGGASFSDAQKAELVVNTSAHIPNEILVHIAELGNETALVEAILEGKVISSFYVGRIS